MKKIYITLSFVIASSLLSAQNKETKTADKLYKKFEYVDAAAAYQKLVDDGKADAYVYKQMAEKYGVSEMTLYRIKSGENWGRVK